MIPTELHHSTLELTPLLFLRINLRYVKLNDDKPKNVINYIYVQMVCFTYGDLWSLS